MRNALKLFLLILPLALCAVAAHLPTRAQQKNQTTTTARPTPAASPQSDERVTTTVRRVRLPITVLDKKGQLVTGLSANDFQILEDKQPQQIETFFNEKESLPLYIAVLMDTSPSTAGKLKFEQESAMNFIQTVVKVRKDRVLFATFDDQVTLRQDFTDKLDLLDKAVFAIKGAGKQTALYDAIWQFCNEKMRNVQGRRALVVITDGEDTYSRARLQDAIDIAQRTETTVFAISTKAGFASAVPGVEAGQVLDSNDRELVRLCEETGGAAFFTGDMLALERSFTKISKELHTQYVVTYRSTNENYNGQFRRIEVKLMNGQGGLKVRAKQGYRALADSVTGSQ